MSQDWTTHLFREFDSLEAARVSACFADDVEVRFGNNPPMEGRAAALGGIEAFWSSISGMSHKLIQLVEDGNSAVQLSDVTYTRHDGSAVTVPVASHVRRNESLLVDRLWVYIDLTPLFAES